LKFGVQIVYNEYDSINAKLGDNGDVT